MLVGAGASAETGAGVGFGAAVWSVGGQVASSLGCSEASTRSSTFSSAFSAAFSTFSDPPCSLLLDGSRVDRDLLLSSLLVPSLCASIPPSLGLAPPPNRGLVAAGGKAVAISLHRIALGLLGLLAMSCPSKEWIATGLAAREDEADGREEAKRGEAAGEESVEKDDGGCT